MNKCCWGNSTPVIKGEEGKGERQRQENMEWKDREDVYYRKESQPQCSLHNTSKRVSAEQGICV